MARMKKKAEAKGGTRPKARPSRKKARHGRLASRKGKASKVRKMKRLSKKRR
ncbi:hypothetical protein L0Y65_05460 [Candidatus Micrarchaeota archaeon]|nr:hypothetical protein [Candidatus Micrarchaeota archaeon]